MTLDPQTPVEVRAGVPAGFSHRTVALGDVEAEVSFLAAQRSTRSVEVRVAGADEWRRVA
jgi:hypothetical protein